MVITNKKYEIFRWFFNNPDSTKACIKLPPVNEKMAIQKIFLDQNGTHCLIYLHNSTNNTGCTFYLPSNSNQVKELSKLKEVHIECVAFDDGKSQDPGNVCLL